MPGGEKKCCCGGCWYEAKLCCCELTEDDCPACNCYPSCQPPNFGNLPDPPFRLFVTCAVVEALEQGRGQTPLFFRDPFTASCGDRCWAVGSTNPADFPLFTALPVEPLPGQPCVACHNAPQDCFSCIRILSNPTDLGVIYPNCLACCGAPCCFCDGPHEILTKSSLPCTLEPPNPSIIPPNDCLINAPFSITTSPLPPTCYSLNSTLVEVTVSITALAIRFNPQDCGGPAPFPVDTACRFLAAADSICGLYQLIDLIPDTCPFFICNPDASPPCGAQLFFTYVCDSENRGPGACLPGCVARCCGTSNWTWNTTCLPLCGTVMGGQGSCEDCGQIIDSGGDCPCTTPNVPSTACCQGALMIDRSPCSYHSVCVLCYCNHPSLLDTATNGCFSCNTVTKTIDIKVIHNDCAWNDDLVDCIFDPQHPSCEALDGPPCCAPLAFA